MSTEVATQKTRQVKPIDDVRNSLNLMAPQIKAALPTHISVDKFIRVAMTAIQINPSLLNCTRQSLYSACMLAAAQGLLPDGREGAIVGYGETAQWLPMVAGICKKARNSGEISSMDSEVVYEKDSFKSWTDEKGKHFHFEKATGERGKPILTFAYAITKDGGFYFEELTEAQVEAIESSSRAKSGPWKGKFRDEMRRKSAIKRLAKYRLPSSTDLDDVLQHDNEEFGLAPEPKEESKVPQLQSARLTKAVEEAEVKPKPKPESPNPTETPPVPLKAEEEDPL